MSLNGGPKLVANAVNSFNDFQNIIGQGAEISVIEEYFQRRGHPLPRSTQHVAELHAYVKPPSNEASFSGTKKPAKGPKTVATSGQQAEPLKNNQGKKVPNEQIGSRSIHKGNQPNSKKKLEK